MYEKLTRVGAKKVLLGEVLSDRFKLMLLYSLNSHIPISRGGGIFNFFEIGGELFIRTPLGHGSRPHQHLDDI